MATEFTWEMVDDEGQRVWRAHAADLPLAVYQYSGGDMWFLTCHELGIGSNLLVAKDCRGAQLEAVMMCLNTLQFRLERYQQATDALDAYLLKEADSCDT